MSFMKSFSTMEDGSPTLQPPSLYEAVHSHRAAVVMASGPEPYYTLSSLRDIRDSTSFFTYNHCIYSVNTYLMNKFVCKKCFRKVNRQGHIYSVGLLEK